MSDLQKTIEEAFDDRAEITPRNVSTIVRDAVNEAVEQLDRGELRVAEKINGEWRVNEWVKKSVLLSFRINDNWIVKGGFTNYYDKVASKYADFNSREFRESGVRVVPPATARKGAYIAPSCVLMPSYVNLGAYVDPAPWLTPGRPSARAPRSGRTCTLSGGVGIGGVLEPLQAAPTIIEDNCFIGARSEIVEGVIVGEGAVISMGVYIGQSTRIYDREHDQVLYGQIPAGAVVVSGNLPADDGKYSLYCAVIVKRVDEKTRSKVGINELLRDI